MIRSVRPASAIISCALFNLQSAVDARETDKATAEWAPKMTFPAPEPMAVNGGPIEEKIMGIKTEPPSIQASVGHFFLIFTGMVRTRFLPLGRSMSQTWDRPFSWFEIRTLCRPGRTGSGPSCVSKSS